jgi:outer membrane murein-binding lipoprotein Lpp
MNNPQARIDSMRTHFAAIRSPFLITAALGLWTLAGCGNVGKNPLWSQVDSKQAENNQLKVEVQKLQQENENYRKQVETLAGMDKAVRMEAMNTLDRMEIAKRTGLLDENKDGKKDTLVVYLKPYDTHGDPIKMAGRARIELWDLNAPADKARLGEWDIQPEELAKLWSSTFLTSYYRLRFDVAKLVEGKDKELTVKAEFTDYVSGRVLREQATIKP